LQTPRISLLYSSLRTLNDLEPIVLKQDLFVNYQRVRNVAFTVLGHKPAAQAIELRRRRSIQKHAA